MTHDPLCSWHTNTDCFEPVEYCWECAVIAKTRADERQEPVQRQHDSLCPNYEGSCCPWMGDCDCQCMCDFIEMVRKDERSKDYSSIKRYRGIDKELFEES